MRCRQILGIRETAGAAANVPTDHAAPKLSLPSHAHADQTDQNDTSRSLNRKAFHLIYSVSAQQAAECEGAKWHARPIVSEEKEAKGAN